MDSIGEPGPSSVAVSRATSAATSLMRSRNSAFSTRSAAQVEFGVALHRADLALQLGAFFDRGGELRLELRDIGAEPVHRAAAAAARRRQFAAQIGLGLARGFELAAHALELIIALGEHAALIAEPRFELLDAAVEHLGFGLLHEELPLEFGGAGAEVAELAARRGQFVRRRFGVGAFARQALLGLRPPRAS